MGNIAVVTDSNSGITQEMGKKMGVSVLPMPFYIDEELFLEDITLTQEEFYKRLREDSNISTSQPAPGDVLDRWRELLNDYDEVVHIPMSSSLSSSCETAHMLSQEFDGKVQVVNNQRISVTQTQSVVDALNLAKEGKSAKEIKKILEDEKMEAMIYITVDTLKYLKKGGRITPAAAAIGMALNLKPVLKIEGGKLDSFAKVRGWKAAKKTMLKAMEKDIKERFSGKDMRIEMAYTCTDEEAAQWKSEIEARFPEYEIMTGKLSLSIACHIGPGAMAIACAKAL